MTEGQQQRAWRRALDWRTPGWCHESGGHWESWSLNGEACITELDPPFAGGAKLASCLTWLVRSFASHCRRTHDATGALAFKCTGPRMPAPGIGLGSAMRLWCRRVTEYATRDRRG